MVKATTKLKELRKSAVPRTTVRKMAELMGMPLGTYSRYEGASSYKKPHLPLDLTRKAAAVLGDRGVDPIEVMKLAGLEEAEAEPEARAVEAARPAVQYVSLPVALPSEAALRDMFRSLLILVPEGASREETAEILARRLPSGFAGIGPFAPDQPAAPTPATDATAPVPSKADPEPRPKSRN